MLTMIIVGELINASRKTIAAAIENKDVAFIQKIARDQFDAGADYIDVNAGVFVGRSWPGRIRCPMMTLRRGRSVLAATGGGSASTDASLIWVSRLYLSADCAVAARAPSSAR